MAPRFDGDEMTLELSVQDLLDSVLLRNLGFSNRGGYERLWLGQAIHSRYQEQALAEDGSFRREVALSYTFDYRGWRITVTGRADGLRRGDDGVRVVEEIKSLRRGGQLSPAQRELYERQAQLYAWLVSRLDEEEVRPELVLIEIGSEEIDRQPVEFDVRAVEAGIKRRASALIRSFEGQRHAARERASAAARMPFPYPEKRSGQHEIVDAVESALAHKEHLLMQAPTGIGKTAATLYPTLRYCLSRGKRLFVLTAKTLQQEMALEVLKLLNGEQAFRSLRLRAKSKMCANDQIICHEEYCPYAKDYYLKLQSTGVVGRLIDDYPTLEPDDIFERAREAVVCPFEVSLELTGQVQVVVCDYNYAFDPYVALSDFAGDADLSDTVLVVDEIHNLVDRGRGYYSPALDAETARRAAERSMRGGAPIHLRIGNLCAQVARTIERTTDALLELEIGSGDGDRAVEAPLPEDAFWELRPLLDEAFIDYLEHNRETKSFRADDPFVSLYFDVLRFLNGLVLSAGDDAFSHCAERRRGQRTVRVLCKDPSRFLGSVIGRTHTTIGLSATLSPSDFYRDLLGFESARTSFEAIPSPFPAENRRVVIDSTVATTYRERPSNYQPIAERLSAFAAAVPGNCLALFPSYSFLAEVATRLPEAGKRVLIQEQTANDRERQEILHHLRSALFGDVLLLAVAGGVFAEGVDYPGDILKAVAVVGPCLPGLSLEQRLLKDYYDERFERGFEYAFVVPGMTRVVQAAGRLIRSAEDTGVIALLDRRFLHKPYRQHLPEDWMDDGNPTPLKGDPARAALDFFAGRDDSESVN
ncbi:MAG: helicase C-terminal domain-containing protein [Acidobacteriota bacterium]